MRDTNILEWQIKAISEKGPRIHYDLIEVKKDIGKPAWQHKGIWLRNLIFARISLVLYRRQSVSKRNKV